MVSASARSSRGTRLSVLPTVAQQRRVDLDISTALYLPRQTVTAVAVLHGRASGVSHGLLAAERVLVTPRCQVVVPDHVFGGAVEQLAWLILRGVSTSTRRRGLRCGSGGAASVTPLGNVALPVGHHDIVFRHPEFGDRQQVLRVRPGSTLHVMMDMK